MKPWTASLLFLASGVAPLAWGQYHLAVFQVDAQVAYIGSGTGINSGSAGTNLFKTTDGGATLSPQAIGAANSINGLWFLNADTGWAVGWGPIYKTTDGGSTWAAVAQGTGEFYYSVFFANADTGFVVGNSTILKTVDGGSVWKPQPIVDCCDSGFALNSVRFTDAETGYAVGNSYIGIDWGYFRPSAALILKTSDGGSTWSARTDGVAGIPHTLNAVSFGNADTGWVVGDSGTILHTSDGGAHWTSQSGGTFSDLHSVCFQGTRDGWIVGDSGTALKTSDGGAHWLPQAGLTASTLRSVFLIDSHTGLIAGDDNTLLKIADGAVALSLPLPERDRIGSAHPVLERGVLRFSLSRPARIKASLYGMDGKERARMEAFQDPGRHALDLSAAGTGPGLYLLDFQGGSGRMTGRVRIP